MTTEKLGRENSDIGIPSFEEVTITKTEIKEEVGDFRAINEIELVEVKEESFTDECESIEGVEESSCLNSGLESITNRYKCDACCLKFEEEKLLKNHYRKCSCKMKKLPKESNGVIFICSFCKFEFLEETMFKQHMKECRTNCLQLEKNEENPLETEKVFRCGKCNYSSKWNCHFKRHFRIHLNEKPFKCTYKSCDCAQFRVPSPQATSCECRPCEFATNNVTNLKNHVLLKHSDAEKRYKCELCDHSTHLKGNMERHLLVHTKEKPYKCEQCEYAAGRKSLLKNHVLAKHSGETKRYKCKVCGHSTHLKADLLVHTHVHSSEKPFKCHYQGCGYESATRRQLTLHVRFRHTREKPFRCDVCEYSSSSKGDLKGHFKRKHSQVKLFN